MTKYLVFTEDNPKPLKKFKRQYEATAFVTDFRNLAEHGCMVLKMVTDSEGSYIWDAQNDVWQRVME